MHFLRFCPITFTLNSNVLHQFWGKNITIMKQCNCTYRMSNKNLMFQSQIKSLCYPASQILTSLVELCAQKKQNQVHYKSFYLGVIVMLYYSNLNEYFRSYCFIYMQHNSVRGLFYLHIIFFLTLKSNKKCNPTVSLFTDFISKLVVKGMEVHKQYIT